MSQSSFTKSQPTLGPVFDKKPGINKKAFLSLFIVLVGSVGLVLGVRAILRNEPSISEKSVAAQSSAISVTVVRGDGLVKLARRALAEYLGQHPDSSLSGGQKVFIEQRLSSTLKYVPKVGEQVQVSSENIASAIVQAKSLTPLQLNAWARYAR